jgi:hypothetical protein
MAKKSHTQIIFAFHISISCFTCFSLYLLDSIAPHFMIKIITVDEAISKGKQLVAFPVYAIMFIFAGVGIAMVFIDDNQWKFILTSFIGALFLPWLCWSFMITRWRVWAFESVRNVHELKKRAISEKLIWPDGSVFEKTEIRTAIQKARLKTLAAKFTEPDVFTDDPSVPAETILRYSKVKSMGLLPLGAVFIAVSIYLFTQHEYKVAGLGIVASIGLLYMGIKQTRNRKIQLILSNKGIKSVDTPFRRWRRISGAEIVKGYLTYNFTDGSESIEINELDISRSKLENLLHVYRGRAELQAGKVE